MEGLRGRLSHPLLSNVKMETSYKMDEGYSEDTRSQEDSDSPIGMDVGNESLLQPQIISAAGHPAEMLALSEADKAGMAMGRLGF